MGKECRLDKIILLLHLLHYPMHKTPIIIIFASLALVGIPLILPLPFSSIQTAAVGATGSADISFKTTTLTAEEGSKVKITLTAPASLTQVTRVRLKVTGGTARSGTDFRIPTTQNITFYRGGLREKSVTLTLNSDSAQESPETITFGLFSQQGQSLNKTLTVTVTNKGTSSHTVTTAIDLNAIPTDTSLDANGWPRYLRVPSDCPKPEQGRKYRHFFDYSRREQVITPIDFKKDIAAYVRTPRLGTGSAYLHTTDEVIYAIPIIASVPQEFGNNSPSLQLSNEQTGFGV